MFILTFYAIPFLGGTLVLSAINLAMFISHVFWARACPQAGARFGTSRAELEPDLPIVAILLWNFP